MPSPPAADATFQEFYASRLARSVRQTALMVGSVAVAEDLVHDAMIELYRRWDVLTNPGAYLYRTLSNASIRHLKRAGRHVVGLTIDRAQLAPSVEFVEMAELLGKLTDRQRIALVLKHYGDLTEAQIADALGCRPGSVGPLLTRANAALRREMGE